MKRVKILLAVFATCMLLAGTAFAASANWRGTGWTNTNSIRSSRAQVTGSASTGRANFRMQAGTTAAMPLARTIASTSSSVTSWNSPVVSNWATELFMRGGANGTTASAAGRVVVTNR